MAVFAYQGTGARGERLNGEVEAASRSEALRRLAMDRIQPLLIASSVRAFLAQRLVRMLCPHCKKPAHHSKEFLEQAGFPLMHASRVFQAVGCEECRHSGYQGRAALFEICLVTPAIQDMITAGKPGEVMRTKALQEGMIPLRQDGWNRVIAGQTTIEEVVRVTAADVDVLDE